MDFHQILLLVLVQLCCVLYSDAQLPLWKNLFYHHRDWEGMYVHAGHNYTCSLTVLSLDLEADAGHVSFTSNHITLDMLVTSDSSNSYAATFRESATWNKSAHFEGHSNLAFHGLFMTHELYYQFVGNVSSDEDQDFGTINFRPEGRSVRTLSKNSDSLKYGLAVGIPVVLAIFLGVLGAMIMVWAVKKGYLRHIPWAYKHFKNPRGTSSNPDYELNESDHGSSENPSVHI